MNSKWPVIGMIVVGIGAALSAAVLVSGLRVSAAGPAGPDAAPEITVIVAAMDLPVARIIDEEAVMTKSIKRSAAPEDALTDPVQVLGKVLDVPLVKGQAVTQSCIAREGSGIHLAATLPRGMRAVAVSLEDYSGLHGMLYPGCMVDVLVSYPTRGNENRQSETLLESVQVLAIEDKSIVAPEGDKDKTSVSNRRRHMVTLMVSPEQAERLQPAMDQGQISLALRHPDDTEHRIAEEPRVVEQTVEEAPKTESPETLVTTQVRGDQTHTTTYVHVDGHWVAQQEDSHQEPLR